MSGAARPPRSRVLVTGATGFIGSALLAQLQDDHEVFALCRLTSRLPDVARVEWIEQDLRTPLRVEHLPRRIDTVIHLAYVGRDTPRYAESAIFTINAACCASLVTYAADAGARRFVYGSTGGVYGRRRTAASERTAYAPYDYYTLSKRHGEEVVRLNARWIPIIVRYYYPYGPGQTNGIVPKLIHWLTSGSSIAIFNEAGNPWINPVYIDDAIRLTTRAMQAGAPLTVNCAGAERTNIAGLATALAERLGVRPTFGRQRDASISNMLGSIAFAARRLRWRPVVSLADGLRATVDGLRTSTPTTGDTPNHA